MDITNKSTEFLLKEYRTYKAEMKRAQEVVSLFNWDLRSRAPKASTKQKLEIIGHFSQERFKISTSEEYGNVLKALKQPEHYNELDLPMQITIDRELESYERFCRVPADFYRNMVVTRGQCEKAWEQAKAENNWELFAPWLEKNLAITEQYARYIQPNQDPYDTLLANSQEGMTCDVIEKLFQETKDGLLPILKKIQEKPVPATPVIDSLTASSETIQKVQEYLLKYIGFDFDRGAVGESVHALTSTIDRNDVRITNKYTGRNPVDIMLSAIHEGGHGLYGQNVDPKYYDTAIESLHFADIHESQSRFMENTLGRNMAFWEPIKKDIDAIWPEFAAVSLEELNNYVNKVQVTQIRTAADELTYCLHIILRFELEKMIFRDHVSVEELRSLWNEKTQELLGILPEDDAHGILQDLHWSSVYFGYFPSYLLGSIYDGMLLEAAEKDLGDITELLRKGECRKITAWLKDKVQSHGSMYNAPEMIRRVCGKEISAAPMLRYFENKHLKG